MYILSYVNSLVVNQLQRAEEQSTTMRTLQKELEDLREMRSREQDREARRSREAHEELRALRERCEQLEGEHTKLRAGVKLPFSSHIPFVV
jgi:cob(I)alamin adenosyltransferase